MEFAERQLPGDGTLTAVFACPACHREMAMLANPMETQLVSGLGIKVGGRTVPEQPLEVAAAGLDQLRPGALQETQRVVWDAAATDRLQNVPSFVRGMVKRIYTDYAREHGISEITPSVMDRARSDLGLEGM
jgi:hypothetical protein